MERFKISDEVTRGKVIDFINRLELKKPYEIVIRVFCRPRTVSQNNLYWLWLACLMDETGTSKEDLHQYFKEKFLPVERIVFKSVEIIKTTSTTTLNTREFSRYLDRIHQFAVTELDIYLPWPEDRVYEDFVFKYKNFI